MDTNKRIKWTVIPCKKTPIKTIWVSLLILSIWTTVYMIYGPFWMFLAVLMLFSAVNTYYLPTTYIIDSEAVVVKRWGINHRRSWDYFQRYHLSSDGIFLSPFKTPNRRDSFRGLFLPYGEDHREAVKTLIEQKIEM